METIHGVQVKIVIIDGAARHVAEVVPGPEIVDVVVRILAAGHLDRAGGDLVIGIATKRKKGKRRGSTKGSAAGRVCLTLKRSI